MVDTAPVPIKLLYRSSRNSIICNGKFKYQQHNCCERKAGVAILVKPKYLLAPLLERTGISGKTVKSFEKAEDKQKILRLL